MKKLPLLFLLLAAIPGLAQLPAEDGVLILNAWRMHPGDDPAWARPDMNDSNWQSSKAPVMGTSLTVVPGFRWYRTTVLLPPSLVGRPLAIGMGGIDEVYELYVEGVSIGRFGHWTPRPASPFDRQLIFAIPPSLVRGPTVHIALRRWNGATSTGLFPFYTAGTARFQRPPELGSLSTIDARTAFFISNGIVRNLPWNLCLFLMFIAGCAAFLLATAQRNRTAYLLLGIYCVGTFLNPLVGGLIAASDSVMRRSWAPVLVLSAYFLTNLTALLFLSRLCVRFRRWLVLGAVLQMFSSLAFTFAIAAQATYTTSSFWALTSAIPIFFFLLAALGLLLQKDLGSVAIGISLLVRQLTETWVNSISHFLGLSDLRFMPVGPVQVDIRAIAELLFVFVTLTVLYLRYRHDQVRQVALEQELAAARSVQQYLIPEHLPLTPGLAIESEYRPAREVGGDFFQVLPQPTDGSVLIVVGDVAGKGMHAGMLATLIVGAIRTAATFTSDPLRILALLNERMQGRGLATCLALRIHQDGTTVLANAGHLPPYLNGEEFPMEGALPLGAIPGIQFPVQTFQLREGDSLFLMTDGVAEAQDVHGQLFGFGRITEMLRSGLAGAGLAAAAQAFGQEDDITVLTVARMAAVA